ncbi:hypothetical protein LCGC14_2682870 [marine sediment metagenome]|uniref:Uncharacterized protein n=1 Tax=marine sediment metagenome TaxID=412755 RepID=A0A0F8ZKW5_9ZZZZ
MPTGSEKGIRILDETTFFWAWSAQGPADHGIFYGRFMDHGIVPLPLPGDVAGELEAHGFYLTPYVAGEWFAGWEKDENHSFHQHPVFAPIAEVVKPVNGGFPEAPDTKPDQLSVSWVELLSCYTAGGKLKKEYRGE